jgi:2-methylcitrate dehydratase PrpD
MITHSELTTSLSRRNRFRTFVPLLFAGLLEDLGKTFLLVKGTEFIRKMGGGTVSVNGVIADVPITKLLAGFATSLRFESIPTTLVAHLKILTLDYICVAVYGARKAGSSDPFYKAIETLSGPGTSTVFTRGSSFQPQYAILLNAAYSHTLDFDNTYLRGIVHPGASVISAALVEGERLGATGTQLITAVAAGYELVCRLALALGNGGYAKGFHNTCTTGIFGAIAAIGSLRGLDRENIIEAFGIAISQAGGSMQFLENGAWNKRLHPGFAAHNAFLAVSFAEAGIVSKSPFFLQRIDGCLTLRS